MRLDKHRYRAPHGGWSDRPQWRITLMRQTGVYPRTTVITQTSAFSATDACTFMVAPCVEWPDELPYSEVMWLNAEELRVLGSLMMTERFDGGQRCSSSRFPTSGCTSILSP